MVLEIVLGLGAVIALGMFLVAERNVSHSSSTAGNSNPADQSANHSVEDEPDEFSDVSVPRPSISGGISKAISSASSAGKSIKKHTDSTASKIKNSKLGKKAGSGKDRASSYVSKTLDDMNEVLTYENIVLNNIESVKELWEKVTSESERMSENLEEIHGELAEETREYDELVERRRELTQQIRESAENADFQAVKSGISDLRGVADELSQIHKRAGRDEERLEELREKLEKIRNAIEELEDEEGELEEEELELEDLFDDLEEEEEMLSPENLDNPDADTAEILRDIQSDLEEEIREEEEEEKMLENITSKIGSNIKKLEEWYRGEQVSIAQHEKWAESLRRHSKKAEEATRKLLGKEDLAPYYNIVSITIQHSKGGPSKYEDKISDKQKEDWARYMKKRNVHKEVLSLMQTIYDPEKGQKPDEMVTIDGETKPAIDWVHQEAPDDLIAYLES